MKIKLKYIAICASMFGLLACQDEVQQIDGNKEQIVRVFGSVLSNSRVSFQQDGNVTHASWNSGDKIGIYGGDLENQSYEAAVDGTGTVEFKTEGQVLKAVDGTNVLAYYPYSEAVEGMVVPLPKTSSYVWSDMKPFVYASNVVENSSVSLKFKHPFAYLRITFGKDDLPKWAELQTLNAIEISAEGQKLGISEGYFSLKTLQQTMAVTTSTIVVDANNFDLSAADFSCYVPVLPQVAAQPLSFKFIQNNGGNAEVLYAVSKNASAEGVLAGYVYDVALNHEELPATPEKLKTRIDEVGKEFVSYVKASDFNEVKNTARYIKETFCENDSLTKPISTWYDACLAAITEKGATRDTTINENYVYSSESYLNEYYYHYSDITRVYAAAQFVGHFSVKNNMWVKEEGDFSDMQFTAPDENGNLCTLKLTTSGNTKKVYIGDSVSEDWYNWTEERKDSMMYEYYPTGVIDSITGVEIMDTVPAGMHAIYKYTQDVDEDTYHNYVVIPENITIEYVQGSSSILKTVIKTNHAALKSDRFDIATEDFSITTETYVNGYEFIMNKMAYGAGKNAETAMKINKDGQNLITLSAYSDLAVSGDLYDKANIDSWGNTTLNMDILHQMQLKFNCTDGTKLEEHLDLAEANDTIETVFKEQLVEINKLVNGGLYFDGQETKVAWVTLEPFLETDWYGDNYWIIEPVMNFSDDSNYSTFSSYFNREDFRSLINMAWDVMDDFINLAKQFDR